MRLTKLKLAGFKSFVDPTLIALPGQLVGVVGPNGCGKSNVMDAVRWVLGESKASELRGESMQDVIFNGSGSRKPVSRASVEMVFDNSLGRIVGQWSQYSELSVKRVLTRNGQSEYYINNLPVRRKDITDLFLGTGLGPRAYAIIGQGTISRIIEARPEELRVFLEEAAGVTKYKERRKETERRIGDTRENLTRVEDIRTELATQMERLEAQAAVARKFRALNDELTQKQHLLWFVKRNDALAECQKVAEFASESINQLEAQTSRLREIEAQLEEVREQHFAATDVVQAAQTELFNANAETARLESEIKHRKESRYEFERRLSRANDEVMRWKADVEKSQFDEERWQELLLLASDRLEQTLLRVEEQQERLPFIEEEYIAAKEKANAQRDNHSRSEKQLQIELVNRQHVQNSLNALSAKIVKLHAEKDHLAEPGEASIDGIREELAQLSLMQEEAEHNLKSAQVNKENLERESRELDARLQNVRLSEGKAKARFDTLSQLQQRAERNASLDQWLARLGLSDANALWRSIDVTKGWETAIEALLREQLNAIATTTELASEELRPETRQVLVVSAENHLSQKLPESSILQEIKCSSPEFCVALTHWLIGVRKANSLQEAIEHQNTLRAGERYVTPEGDIVDRVSITYFASNPTDSSGLLERQREIDELALSLENYSDELLVLAEAKSVVLAQLDDAKKAELLSRQEMDKTSQKAHSLQLEQMKATQAQERYKESRRKIEEALNEVDEELQERQAAHLAIDETIELIRETLFATQADRDASITKLENVERGLKEAQTRLNSLEREYQDATFSEKECKHKLDDLRRNLAVAAKQLTNAQEDICYCETQLMGQQTEDLEPKLQSAIEQRVVKEALLAKARDDLESMATLLREYDEARLRLEHSLEPLRASINELRLKEQAAKLSVEQFEALLLESNANIELLSQTFATSPDGMRPNSLQGTISSLQKSIEALGAVNLAALEELDSAKERKGFLDAQSEDLMLAMNTLENAIRKIDRETRELLKATFDTVNRNFGTLFPSLFGGGEAKLIMTGEEILDAGVQVMAQPPGKKNSTIYLLSGGEKALTAIALVFAMFQLNPAPFCLLDEVDAPLDDTNTERFCSMVKRMSINTQFLFISHNKIAMEMAEQLVGVTMQESGVSRIVEVDMEEALRMREQIV